MPSWNSSYLIFNDSTVASSVADRAYKTGRVVAPGAEARNQKTARRYWYVNLSNLLLSGEQLEEIRAITYFAVTTPVLFRIAQHCLVQGADGEPVTLENLGGNQHQIRKKISVQGREDYENVLFPNYDYPDLLNLHGDTWEALPPIQIFSNGSEIFPTIDRNTGIVSSSAPNLTALGGFYTKLLCPPKLPISLHGCMFRIQEGVVLEEPRGE